MTVNIRYIFLRFRQNVGPPLRKQAREPDQIFAAEYFPQRAVALRPMIRNARPQSPAPARFRSRLPPLVRPTPAVHSHRQLPGLDNDSGCHHRQFAPPQFFCSSEVRSRAEPKHIAKLTSQGRVWLLPPAPPAVSRLFPRVVRRSLPACFADSTGEDRRERPVGQPVPVSRLQPIDSRSQWAIPAAAILAGMTQESRVPLHS